MKNLEVRVYGSSKETLSCNLFKQISMTKFISTFFSVLFVLLVVSCNPTASNQTSNEHSGKANNDSSLIIYAADGSVISYNLELKKQNWEYKNPGEVENWDNTFTIENDLVYVPFSKGSVVALNARNGEVKWTRQLLSGQDLSGLKDARNEAIDSSYVITGQSAMVDKDKIYISARNSLLYALDKNDGKILWKAALNSSYTNYPPLSMEGFLYTNNATFLYKFDTKDGKQMWKKEFQKHPLNAEPVSDGKHIYTSDSFTELYATGQDSRQQWKFKSATDGGLTYDHLVLGNGIVYIMNGDLKDNTTIIGVSTSNGAKKWSSVIENETVTYFTLIGDTIYAYSDETLIVLDAQTGEQQFKGEFPSFDQPGQENAISNIVEKEPGIIMFLSNNGLVSFETATGEFSIDYGIQAPQTLFPRNVTWISLLPANLSMK